MKRKILVIAVILTATTLWLSAQDVIVMRDSRRISAIVTEVNVNDIKYKLFSNQDGPTYTLLKNDIASILYQNGDEETFARVSSPSRTNASDEIYQSPLKEQKDYSPWHVGLSAGVTLYGCESIPNAFGLHAAYFFNPTCGAGLAAVKTTIDSYIENLFLGPAFFAHMRPGNSIVFFPARIGLGIQQCKVNNRGEALFGGYASAGIAFRPFKLMSFGINAEYASAFEDMQDMVWEDFAEFFGINICISFHF